MPWLWSYNKIDKNSGIYSGQDKLGEGPCADAFDQLKRCAYERGFGSASNRDQIKACPAQADVLIHCLKRNPRYFHGRQQQQQQQNQSQQPKNNNVDNDNDSKPS